MQNGRIVFNDCTQTFFYGNREEEKRVVPREVDSEEVTFEEVIPCLKLGMALPYAVEVGHLLRKKDVLPRHCYPLHEEELARMLVNQEDVQLREEERASP